MSLIVGYHSWQPQLATTAGYHSWQPQLATTAGYHSWLPPHLILSTSKETVDEGGKQAAGVGQVHGLHGADQRGQIFWNFIEKIQEDGKTLLFASSAMQVCLSFFAHRLELEGSSPMET